MYANRYRIPNQLQPTRPGLLDLQNPNMIPGVDLRCLPSAVRAQNELVCPSNPNLSNLRINVLSAVIEYINYSYGRITVFWETDPRTCLHRNFTNRDMVSVDDYNKGYRLNYPLQQGRTYSYMDLDTNRRFYKTVIKGFRIIPGGGSLNLRINGVESNNVEFNVVNRRISDEALQSIIDSNDDILDRYLTGY